jgi:NitT/TauT family transport system permease protein
MTGKNGVSIWGYVGSTLVAALVGTLLALLVGGVGGLICGGNARLYEILRPLIAALNAVPRIALIPIIVLIVGTSPIADLLSAALVGVFIVFYNALEGSRSVTWETVHSVKLLGASRTGILLRVRGPYTLAWIFASVPNTISFGLQGAVTAELFSGVKGVGQLLTTAVDTANSALTFATVVVVGVVGIILVQSAEFARSRLMGWWDSGGGAADR